jgi:hypothetical protein
MQTQEASAGSLRAGCRHYRSPIHSSAGVRSAPRSGSSWRRGGPAMSAPLLIAVSASRLRGFVAAEVNEVPGVVEQAASEIVRGADGGERCIGGLVAVAVSEAGTGHGTFGQSCGCQVPGGSHRSWRATPDRDDVTQIVGSVDSEQPPQQMCSWLIPMGSAWGGWRGEGGAGIRRNPPA